MKIIDGLVLLLWKLLPMAIVMVLSLLTVLLLRRWADRRSEAVAGGNSFQRDVMTLVILMAAAVPIFFAMPVSEHTRDALFTLFGVAITAVVSLGSSTFASNAMAGLMLRLIRHFKVGDYIHVEDWFGRVTERGLLHTEIQTEHSELVTFPNLFMVTHPVRVIRPSGTFISTELSLGYDIDSRRIETLLIEAAESVGLEKPFVRVLHLGDYSVSYEVAGKLIDTRRFLGARSALSRAVLDSLHGSGVEIVSPSFMNQRRIPTDRLIIPRAGPESISTSESGGRGPDAEVFDKADRARKLKRLKDELIRLKAEIQEMEKNTKGADAEEKERLEKGVSRRKDIVKRLGDKVEELTAENEES